MRNPFKLFFVPIIQLFFKFYPQLLQLPRPSPSAESVDSELVAPLAAGDNDAVDQAEAPTQATGDGTEKQTKAAGLVVVHHMEWAEIVIAFCLASAVDIAILSVQVHSQLPALFHLFSLAILLAFASVVVSKVINPKFLRAAQVLEKCGIFFGFTAFFIAITISFPFYLKFAGILSPIFTKLLSKFYPRASSSSDTVDPELPDLAARDDAVDVGPAEAARLVVVHRHHGQHHMDWTDVMLGFSA
ncbi:hypothetical protein SO802_030534 [Lithocarpus litseifolius]|uniref:Uncharacterized protein n=1 Tax=Lithocarpus litseifolius TaxID=425828 RepID=A0AAW2BJ48_9ROSI